jgi:hypothetical protein
MTASSRIEKTKGGAAEEILRMPVKRTVPCRIAHLILLSLMTMIFLSACAEMPGAGKTPTQMFMTFADYMGKSSEVWFLTGKKEYSVQAMMVSGETSFHNELEVTDYTVTDDGITVILKGKFGEMWTSKLPKVISTYAKPDGSALSAADFEEKDSWIEITARPEPDAYYAMHVPLNISVTVETAWGDVLHTNLPNAPHGEGDYLVCRVGEDRGPDLSDVWILNGMVFPEYYDTSRYLIESKGNMLG